MTRHLFSSLTSGTDPILWYFVSDFYQRFFIIARSLNFLIFELCHHHSSYCAYPEDLSPAMTRRLFFFVDKIGFAPFLDNFLRMSISLIIFLVYVPFFSVVFFFFNVFKYKNSIKHRELRLNLSISFICIILSLYLTFYEAICSERLFENDT